MTTRIVEFADGFTSATPPDTTGYLLTTNVGDDLCPLDGDHLVPLVNLPVLTNAKIPLLDIDKIPVLTEDKLPMIPSNKLPSYVDDVVEVANYAALPVTGETGKIYIALDTNVTYRWSGSAYVQIGQNITSTDNVSEGATNKYYTATRAQGDAVVNAVTGGETNKAPSVAAIKAYVDANSSNGVTDVDVLAIDNYDAAQLADYTQTGLAFNTTTQIHGVKSAQLIHDPLVNQSYKKVIAVDRKFRGQMIELSLANRSTATDGNLTLLVTDETNSAVISASQSIQTDSFTIAATTANTSTTISGLSNTDANKLMPGMAISGAGIALNTLITSVNAVAGTAVISVAATASATVTLRISALPKRRTFTFTVPQTCASLSYTVTALPEANSPRSTLDDVVFKLASMSLTSTSVDLPVITTQSSLFSSTTAFGNVDITGALSTSSGSGVYSYNSATGVYTFLKAATVDISASLVASSATQCMAQIQYNATQVGLGASTTGGAGYGGTTSWTGKVAIGDTLKVRNSTSGTTSQAYISVTATAYDTSIKTIPLTQSALIQDADSTIRLDSHNGYGSTANKIPRFTNIQQNIGDAILYTDSSVNGASFTVLKSGVYSFSFSLASATSTGNTVGLSKNSTQLSTAIDGITSTDRLAQAYVGSITGTSADPFVSWTGYLIAGDVIRPHTSGIVPTNSAYSNFTASYQGSLKQASVNANSKAAIPTSELRFEGANARGTGSETAIVKFDAQTKIRGDAFIVDMTNGTKVTMTKAGLLNVTSTTYSATAGDAAAITINQVTLSALPTANSEILSLAYSSGTNQLALSASRFVNVGDVIRVCMNQAPATASGNMFNLTFQEMSVQVGVSNTLPQFSETDSCVRVYSANGWGSSNTAIRRFSSTATNLGSSVVYADSATLGASFTIMESGNYEISYTDVLNVSASFGLSKNSPAATLLGSLSTTDILSFVTTSGAGGLSVASWSGPLVAGDVIRPHAATASLAAHANGVYSSFTIAKIGKSNVSAVDVSAFVNVPQPDKQILALTGGTANNSVATGFSVSKNTNNGIISYDSTTGRVTVLKKCNINIESISSKTTAGASDFYPYISKNGTIVRQSTTNISSAGYNASVAYNDIAEAGEYFNLGITTQAGNGISATFLAQALSDQILTAPETFSSDTAGLTYASSATYTLATLANAPIGTFITYTYPASSNNRTQTTTAPTQTTTDMNSNGFLVYARNWSATSTAAQPTEFNIQIGKGLKGFKANAYTGAAKAAGTDVDFDHVNPTTNTEYGTTVIYNETTGVLTINAGNSLNAGAGVTRYVGLRQDNNAQPSAYFVINASKNPALTGMNLNKVAARGVNSSGPNFSNNFTTVLTYDAIKSFDTHGALNTATGVFTAPETGYYQVNVGFQFGSATYAVNNVIAASIFKNSVEYSRPAKFSANTTTSFVVGAEGSDTVYLSKGDLVDIRIFNERGATTLNASSVYNFFSIVKVGP